MIDIGKDFTLFIVSTDHVVERINLSILYNTKMNQQHLQIINDTNGMQ